MTSSRDHSPTVDSASYDAATRDGASGLLLLPAFLDFSEKALATASRYQHPFSVLVVELDYTGALLEMHGRKGLIEIENCLAQLLGTDMRDCDIVGHMDASRFIVSLPNSDILAAAQAGEKIRESVEFRLGSDIPKFTVSIGATQAAGGEEAIAGIILRAEEALKGARKAGRNCVDTAPAPALQEQTRQ